ncbi:AI-2E family transporter [Glycomyces xiaoerkulensis]|uniref:AI-2E family transporter n=1 Tax=Glycomyces xiaoerkulensis TaxID=2038139 RepID=UPI0012FFF3F2|nr:AI-2E family transporter [Glycomyces xiaoerkulensis]
MSRFRRTADRARRLWIGWRLSPERLPTPTDPEEEPRAALAAGGEGLPPEIDEDDDGTSPERRFVPTGLAVGAAWSWRLLVIAAAIIGGFYLIGQIAIVVIPLTVSFLLAAMLQPIAGTLIRHGWNKSVASILVLIAGLGVVGLVLTFVVQQFIAGVPDFWEEIQTGLTQLQNWLEEGPYGLDGEQMAGILANAQDNVQDWFTDNQETLVEGGLTIAGSTATGLAYFVTGLFLVLFTTYFFMRDGRKIWLFMTGMLPQAAKEPMRYAGGAGWTTLVQYMRMVVVVAATDAIFIGVGLYLLEIPLALPLATLVFLGGFIPIVGATVSGAVAVVVALVGTENGLWNAVFVLAIVLAVQQMESNLLQPILMSRAVKLHPLAIVLAVTGGGFAFGIIGALIAVPLLAIINGTVRALQRFREARREIESREAETGEDATDLGEESIPR